MSNDAPAYQEYAASMLTSMDFREMSLAQRGLLYTLRLECWVNSDLPSDPEKLGRLLGISVAELARLLPSVMPFFNEVQGRIFSPDLERYRNRVLRLRTAQEKAARDTNKKRKEAKTRLRIVD